MGHATREVSGGNKLFWQSEESSRSWEQFNKTLSVWDSCQKTKVIVSFHLPVNSHRRC